MALGRAGWFWCGLSAALLISRLAHRSILWADEDYHLAGAIQVLWGKLPYRDFWYDKPPLNLLWYLWFGARTGVLLRLTDTLFGIGCCALAWRFASQVWSRKEGYIAAALLAFFLIFYLPAGVIPLEPDSLMIAPHLAAVYLAWMRRPLLAGMFAGLASLLNAKAVFVLAACALFNLSGAAWLLCGFLLPNVAALLLLAAWGALPAYWQQVWLWGFRYSGAARGGLATLFGWLGFHAALVLGVAWWWLAKEKGRMTFLAWAVLSLASVAAGWRFAPRYFLQLLPVLAILAARGMTIPVNTRLRAALLAISLAVPLVRFGPRYLTLLADDLRGEPHHWTDVALDQESRRAAALLAVLARPEDSVFIWGYRPNVIAYSRMPVGARVWDSQPLTGVPADRHLTESVSLVPEWAARNRADLVKERPDWIVDGLSAYNPRLAIESYPDLHDWLARYCPAATSQGTRILHRCR